MQLARCSAWFQERGPVCKRKETGDAFQMMIHPWHTRRSRGPAQGYAPHCSSCGRLCRQRRRVLAGRGNIPPQVWMWVEITFTCGHVLAANLFAHSLTLLHTSWIPSPRSKNLHRISPARNMAETTYRYQVRCSRREDVGSQRSHAGDPLWQVDRRGVFVNSPSSPSLSSRPTSTISSEPPRENTLSQAAASSCPP
jgi:hypothetical protein